MPNEFLSKTQRRQYGRFEGEPNESQLTRYFHLDNTDLELINNCRGDHNRLGFALQLTTVRFLGTFLPDPTKVPRNVLHFVARQLANVGVGCLGQYLSRKQTRYTHREDIQLSCGYHDFNAPPWRFRLSRVLYSRAWISNERPSLMFDMATAWLIQYKVLLPGATVLSRLVGEIRERASNRLWRRLSLLPSAAQRASISSLLEIPERQRGSRFDRYRKGPVRISGPALIEAVDRYLELRAFGIHELDFSAIPPVRLKTVARHAGITSQYRIARMSEDKRIAILVAFVKAFETTALDDALDVLDLLITDIAGQARKLGKKKRLRSLKDLDRSALALAEVCAMVLNMEMDDRHLREAIFARVPIAQLERSISVVYDLARPPDDRYHDEMVEQYGRVKRFLPKLLNSIRFKNAPAGESTMDALNYLAALGPTRK